MKDMTIETAIANLKADIKYWEGTTVSADHLYMAIKSLQQEPCNDCISRQAVLDLINADWKYEGLEEPINSLPSVTPQPKTGQWFIDERPESDRETICSNCEQPIFKYHKMDFDYRPKYCPNCGAKMVEDTESEG